MGAGDVGIIGVVEQVEHWAQGYHRDCGASRKRIDWGMLFWAHFFTHQPEEPVRYKLLGRNQVNTFRATFDKIDNYRI